MPKTLPFPWLTNLFHRFANIDKDPESLEREEGTYLDAQNMRVNSIDGHGGSIEKIHGEIIKYSNIDNRCPIDNCVTPSGVAMPLTYMCIGSTQVLNHIVEFWADELQVGAPYVRVYGWIVLMPSKASSFPISTLFPPQIDNNDSCVGGEIFYTDDNIPPFILNVTDMLENAGINPANNLRDNTYQCTSKYYCGFNIQDFQIQPPVQVDHPVFIEIVPSGGQPNVVGTAFSNGSGGLLVGRYQYAIQYQDAAGNVTNWSELTPMIPVPASMSFSEPDYPSTKVFGGIPGLQSALGVHIRFRITNLQNFAQINIRRITWDVGGALTTPANDDSVIFQTPTSFLSPGQIGVIDFYDYQNTTIEPVTQQSSTQSNLTSIQAAKGIRYYQSKLTLWNITYASRDLAAANITFNSAGGTMYPFVRPLGQQGYKDIWNDVYRESYFRGERYGFALVGFDNDGNPSFALPIPSFDNHKMPNRRDQLTGPSLAASVEVQNSVTYSSAPYPLTSAVNDTGGVTPTYEIFDLCNAVPRATDDSTISSFYGNPITMIADRHTPPKMFVNPSAWNPFKPTSDSDSNNFNYIIDASVNDGSFLDPSIGSGGAQSGPTSPPMPYPGFLKYNPRGFLPNMYALGMILSGIQNLPNWVSGFAIVRTAPAGRVIAQGQGFYNLNNAQSSSGTNTPVNKDTNGMVWDSPDFFFGLSPTNTIVNNISRYKMQVVSAVGFFSEVYHGYAENSETVGSVAFPGFPSSAYDRQIDMICYARILSDSGQINPIFAGNTMNGTVAFGTRFVSFASWRNSVTSPSTYLEEIPMAQLSQNWTSGNSITMGSSPRRNIWYWKSGGPGVYATVATGGGNDYIDIGAQNWQEPLYATNIVDDTQNVTSSLVQDYYQTGCFIKTSSIIGKIATTSNVSPSFYLVDERWQDCIPAERIIDATANQNRYVWIQDANGNQTAWLNVTYMTAAQISTIATAIANNGFYTSTNCSGTVNVYGMYSHRITTYTNGNLTSAGQKFYQIVFDQKFPNGNPMVPDANDYVIVKYDACAPIEIFGGDTFIGDYTYPVADCIGDSDGNPLHSSDKFAVDCPLPYRAWQINENTYIVHDNDPVVGSLSIQGYNLVRFTRTSPATFFLKADSYIRQLLVNGIVESRANTALFFNTVNGSFTNGASDSFFPNINYVIRPIQWRKWPTNIQGSYNSTYADEAANNGLLGYGGFRINPDYNIDYSQSPTQDKSYSKPSAGFTEELNFCTRAWWSDTRTTNEKSAPGLRNFPSTNIYDFDDATGGINRAWDSSNAGQQGNLYAFTNTGVVMAETNKSILSSISGGQLAEIGGGNTEFIQAEVWLSRDKGMPDGMWRSAAEYSNVIYWADFRMIYRLENNHITDIGQDALYYNKVYNILQTILPNYGSDLTAVWNDKYNEYWLAVNPHRVILTSPYTADQTFSVYDPVSSPSGNYVVVKQDQLINAVGTDACRDLNVYTVDPAVVNEFYVRNDQNIIVNLYPTPSSLIPLSGGIVYRVFYANGAWNVDTNIQNLCNDIIYNEPQKGFAGQYKFRYDKYVMDQNGNLYGQRLGSTYLLDTGYIQDGSNIQAWVLQVANPKEGYGLNKEFLKIRVNSNNSPDTILFFQTFELYNSGTPHSQLTGYPAIKNYGSNVSPSWEGWVPRGMNIPHYKNQGRYSIYQVFYAQPSEFWISSVQVQAKVLK